MITTIVYRDSKFAAHNPPLDTLATLHSERNIMLWIDLSAPTPEEIKLILEDLLALHPLVIEDCIGEALLPKLEEYDDYLHLVMHAVDYSKADKFSTTDLDIVLGKNFVLSLHRQPLRPVQIAIERTLRSTTIPVRGPDRIAHTILDLIADAYKPATDELGEEFESIENGVLSGAKGKELFPQVVSLRKDLAQLRQIVSPQREIAAVLAQGKLRFIRPAILPYFRDLAEDLSNIERRAIGWSDQLLINFRIYLNKSSHQANQGIRVITSLTALTIPPLLIGAWFGMNFRRMPELSKPYAYLIVVLLTLLTFAAMFCYMRKKRWL